MSNLKKFSFPKANKEIKAKEVRLVDENGEMIGVVNLGEALYRAGRASLDLVEISPQAEPPVCKILDFGRYKYEAKKKLQDSKKKQKIIALKEVKFRLNIGQHDFDVKIKNTLSFLQHGDKVKVSLWFKGREIVHKDLGMLLIQRVLDATAQHAKVDSEAKMEGKQSMILLLSPLTK